MIKIDVKEIHGFDPKLGLRCFKESLLNNLMEAREIHKPTLRTESPQQRSENKYYGNEGQPARIKGGEE